MNRALLVGINQYDCGSNLSGCLNDIGHMREKIEIERWLTGCGEFKPENIARLYDIDASGSLIKAALKNMIQEAQPGDHLLWWYSGHGSQVPDTNGDESDRLDEIICPSDLDFDNPDTFITDDEVKDLLVQLPDGVRFTAGFDSCHSGTMEKDINKGKFIENPIIKKAARVTKCFWSWLPWHHCEEVATTPILPKGVEVVIYSGCKNSQTSADATIDGEAQGAFTAAFLKSLTKGSTPETIIADTNKWLKNHGYSQTPQLYTSNPNLLNSTIF